MYRPQTILILAMTADGKIADKNRAAARFGSTTDKFHLETQIALVDAVLFGAGTLRAYGTTLPISHAQLLEKRTILGKAPQPLQIVVSASGKLDCQWKFFAQPIPRCLLTTEKGAAAWLSSKENYFQTIFVAGSSIQIDWQEAFSQLSAGGVEKIAILGGGQLVASLLEWDLIDEIYLTICPFIFGGINSPTAVGGMGFPAGLAKRLKLLNAQQIEQEVFLHYEVEQCHS